MKYANLGRSGLKVSRICLGCMTYGKPATTPEELAAGHHSWTLSEEQSQPFFHKALEHGINFFDTANGYSDGDSEEVLGRFLKKNVARETVVIATKVYAPMRKDPNGVGLSRKAIMHELDQSLRRLQTDYIDLYQTHYWDGDTPIDETLEAFNDAVRAGKVLYLGACMPNAWQFAKALYRADLNSWTRFVSMQNHYNLLYREEEREMLPLCREEGIGVIPWSPLARGRLTRPWQSVQTDRLKTDRFGQFIYSAKTEEGDKAVVDKLCEIAGARNVAPARIALAWLLSKPGIVAPIVGATKPVHLDDAVAALEIVLTPEEIAALEAPYHPRMPVFS